MADHDGQTLTPREMVRAHAWPVLAAISTLSLLGIAVLLVPVARQASTFNSCVDATVTHPDVKPYGRSLATVICNGFIPPPQKN